MHHRVWSPALRPSADAEADEAGTPPVSAARIPSARAPEAVKLADQLLNLRHRGTVRMLAVVSDGWYSGHIEAAQRLITTLHRTGCAVLWLHPGDSGICHTYTHTTTVTVTNPTSAIDVIADAAITALTQA